MSFTRRPGSGSLDRPVVDKTAPSFNLSSDDSRVRVLRPRVERLNTAFALQQHTALTAGVMVWGAIAYNAWLALSH
ncbi:hypothetical protein TNCV_3327051 [Trichonephila clavipes]|nr:hypothetical protein TNCV_3327051 [Trichonephila clavipes]